MFRKSLIASLLLAAPIASAGCMAEPAQEGPAAEDVNAERGPIGKADLYGQCMEIDIKYCGGKSSGNCWCDELCESYGDCCSDYQAECTDDGPTCDPTLICGQAITCVEGQWYPTTCGPANCDAPMGPCGDPEPKDCGGFAGLTCDDGEFCNYAEEDGCGFADAMGTCEPKPDFCPEVYQPVCGCNGNTYGNACDANAAGTSVQFEGDCECGEGMVKQFCWGQSQCVPIGAQC
jgi:hypothetical protein